MSSLVTPKSLLAYSDIDKKFPNYHSPEVCIICFTSDFFHAAKKFFAPHETGPQGLLTFEINNKRFALFQALLGTPSASISLENLHALGFLKFIAIGSAGSLQDRNNYLPLGELVVGTSAFRDEGCSAHYLDTPNLELQNESLLLQKWLTATQDIKKVKAWTTEAPYRETHEKFQKFLLLGATVVEMEMACLLAVAQYRNLEILNLFVVSDILSPNSWVPGFFSPELKKGKELLLTKIKAFLELC